MILGLLRRFVVGFMNGHDSTVCREIMAPDYTLRVGDDLLVGRDTTYEPAVRKQLQQFPGMVLTVHDVITNRDAGALVFTEHGASGGDPARIAAWSGIALYRSKGDQLVSCGAVEDYFARRIQLKSGKADIVAAPAPAPWDTKVAAPDAAAEAVVRAALERGLPEAITRDGVDFAPSSTEVLDIFSAGPRVAFHVRHVGTYRGGFADAPAAKQDIVLYSAGLLDVSGDAVTGGRVIRDRAALRRQLEPARP